VHSALSEIYLEGGNYTWVIQGDLSKSFDSIPHDIIMQRIHKTIKCQRTLELIKKALSAGYVEPETGKTIKPNVGTPQGSVLSPLLCNIVLHEFDLFMNKQKENYHNGTRRKPNLEFSRLMGRRRYTKDLALKAELLHKMRKHHTYDPMDSNFKRLKYIRYADDFVVLLIGPRSEALIIRDLIKQVLMSKCGLELNFDKIVISHIEREGFKFLGADCGKAEMLKNPLVLVKGTGTKRATTRLRVFMDTQKVFKKLVDTKFAKWSNANPHIPIGTALNAWINHEHAEILAYYNCKLRGLNNFYSFAGNRRKLLTVCWILTSSCALTLAKKYKLRTQGAVFKKYGRLLRCPDTGLKLDIPKSFEVNHDYNTKTRDLQNLDFLDST